MFNFEISKFIAAIRSSDQRTSSSVTSGQQTRAYAEEVSLSRIDAQDKSRFLNDVLSELTIKDLEKEIEALDDFLSTSIHLDVEGDVVHIHFAMKSIYVGDIAGAIKAVRFISLGAHLFREQSFIASY
jgi:uncharacterized FlaG/YvyC family protein